MHSTELNRINNETRHPRILDLHFALQRLRSTVSFMNSGAHPDDETSAMLAALGLRDGLDISFTCANRGEGGQNTIGTESGDALGTLRTAEMECAAAELNMRLYWLSTHPADSITDFGFSKSGLETLTKWQHEHTLNRFVTIVRREKPDILCPTFLDVPGQHGHHRAMTQLAHEVFTAAADASRVVNYKGQALPPWTVTKLYLPAWGGGGTSYDDELPPPPATLTVSADGIDERTGWSWERIGQQSRRHHLTQGMGRWIAAGTERNWPLHLALSTFTDPEKNCPPSAVNQIQHRLSRKISQLSGVIRICSGVDVHAVVTHTCMRPGDTTTVEIESRNPIEETNNKISFSAELEVDKNWQQTNNLLILSKSAKPTDPYPCDFFPDQPRKPAVKIELNADGVVSQTLIELVNTPLVLPEFVVNLKSSSTVINCQSKRRSFSVPIESCFPNSADISISSPKGWTCKLCEHAITAELPQDVEPGHYELDFSVNGHQAQSERIIEYAHAPARVLSKATRLNVLVLDVILPKKRIAYVGGGNDHVSKFVSAMGLDITDLNDEDLSAEDEDLSAEDTLEQFDTLVVGLFAMRTRPALAKEISKLHRWIEKGGHLLTLYHRPWDNWIAEDTPPRYLEIGQPSLRFRVTDENATVTHLLPDHPLLNTPNKIADKDWRNWHKERGLYFAKTWHEDYQALLSMHDQDEKPLTGSLLSAEIGRGRHTHTSLILHHQMAKLVPGSFRLMANLLN